MLNYLLIASPSAAALYVMMSALTNVNQPQWSWWHPFAGAFLAFAVAIGAAVVRLFAATDARIARDNAAEKARRDIEWCKMSDAEKDVILELRKQTGTP